MRLRNPNRNFTQIPNEIITDRDIRGEPLSMLLYFLSKPDDWIFYVSNIKKELGITNHTRRKCKKILEEKGYIKHEKKVGKNGKFSRTLHIMDYLTIVEKTTDGTATDGTATDGKAHDITNTNNTNTDNTNTKKIYSDKKNNLSNKQEKKKKEKNPAKKEKRKKFSKPTLKEIQEYVKEKQLKHIDPEQFFYFYDAKDWYVGKTKMKNWRSAVSGWNVRNRNEKAPPSGAKGVKSSDL